MAALVPDQCTTDTAQRHRLVSGFSGLLLFFRTTQKLYYPQRYDEKPKKTSATSYFDFPPTGNGTQLHKNCCPPTFQRKNMSSSSSLNPVERRRVTSVQQLEKLVKLMENQLDLALCIGRSKEDRADSARVWQKHAATLNAVPGAHRSAREWCRAWNDLKCRVNSKLRKNRALRIKGEEPAEFSAIELRVARIITQSLTRKPRTRATRDPSPVIKRSVAADILEDNDSADGVKPKLESNDPLSRQIPLGNKIEVEIDTDLKLKSKPRKRALKLIANIDKLKYSHLDPDTDEFQLFASNIAAQLRELPLDRAMKLQVDIQTLVANERVKFFEELKAESEMFFVSENDSSDRRIV